MQKAAEFDFAGVWGNMLTGAVEGLIAIPALLLFVVGALVLVRFIVPDRRTLRRLRRR